MAEPQRDLVFISYSHRDKKWLSDLLTFLKPYQRKGMEVWADPYIKVGSRWERDINHALSRACVGVLLVSQEFLASDFIYESELPPLTSAADRGDLTLVCVPLSSFTFDASDLDEYQWARDPQQPLAAARGNSRRRALVEITNAIVEAAGNCSEPSVETTKASVSVPMRGAAARASVSPEGPLGSLIGVPQQRPHHIPRSDELNHIKRLILDQAQQAVGITAQREEGGSRLGVQGRGGIGKTVLAIDLVNDGDVRQAFPDGIYWTTLGQTPSLEQLQSDLLEKITGETAIIENPQQGRQRLGAALEHRNALLVLDDVWQPAHARALDVIGPVGRLVVTTRDSGVVTALGAEELALDALSPEASLELLAQWSGTDRESLPPQAAKLAEACGRLPLALTLAGAQVRDGRSWSDLMAALQAGRLDYLDHPYGSVFSSMHLSLDALEETQRARLLELAVFPEDLPIPEATILRYWSLTGGLADYEARALLQAFKNKGLLYLRQDGDDAQVVELHDLQRDFLLLLVDDPEPMHEALLQAHAAAYRQDADDWGWWRMPASEPYLWDWLGLHLREAGRPDEFRRLLFDYRWLKAKLQVRGLNHLLTDYEGFPPRDDAGLIRSVLELSAHVLTRAPRQLAPQLMGRLMGLDRPEIQGLCESIRQFETGCWLAPQGASLIPPGGALLRTFSGHEREVTGVSLTPDGRRAVSASDDGTLKVWDLERGELLWDLRGHKHVVTAVSLTRDGHRAVSASGDRTLKVWDLERGKYLYDLQGHEGSVTAVSLTTDDRWVVSASADRTLKVWDLEQGELLQDLRGHENGVTAVSLTPDGHRAVSASHDGTFKVWDLERGELLQELRGHERRVTVVSLTPDGRRVVSAFDDGTLKVWDLERGELLQELRGHEPRVTVVSLTLDGHRAVSASSDGTLKVWDLEQGKLLLDLWGHEKWVTAVSLTSDGHRAVSASSDGTLKVWDLEQGKLLQDLRGHEAEVTAVSLTPDGRRAVSASEDRTLKLWDLEQGELLQDLRGHEGPVTAVSLSTDNRWVVSASEDRTLKAWDLERGELLWDLRGHEGLVSAVSLTRDGHRAVSASHDQTLKVWDLERGELLQDLRGHTHVVYAVRLTSDGRRAVSASEDKTLKVWDLERGELLQDLRGHEKWVTAVSLTRDGHRAVSASGDRTLKVWDLERGEHLYDLRGNEGPVTAVSLTPDDRWVVSASEGRTLKVWDLERGELLWDLQGHGNWVTAFSLTPDGRRAASASNDKTLKLWDLERGELLQDLRGHEAEVTAVSLTPDGRRAVSASNDRTLKLWDLETGQWMAEFHAEGSITCLALRVEPLTIIAGDALGYLHFLKVQGCDC